MPNDPSSTFSGISRLQEVYSQVANNEELEIPLSFEALEAEASEALESVNYEHISSGAGTQSTTKANTEAFDRWRIVPRVLRDVEDRDLSFCLFGQSLSAPVALAPIGLQSLIHPEGEVATANAAAALDVPFTLSSASSKPLEDVADVMDASPRWFQLYTSADREVTASLLDRAEKAGYSAVVITVDLPVRGWRPHEIEHGYSPDTQENSPGNYFSDPVFKEALDAPPEEDPTAAIQHFKQLLSDSSLTWEDLAFVREQTDLPVILKGILHPDDAERAVKHDIDGIIVSNHGGNHLDGAISSLEALPEIVKTVDEQIPVLFDSGIRNGTDIFKAISLGAEAVLVGRPYLYGLAIAGQTGVKRVLENIVAELDLTMALAGCCSIEDIRETTLVHNDEL